MHISIGKSKNKEFLYILRSYRNSDNKSSTQIYKKLGSMDSLLPLFHNDRQQVLDWAREQARIATEQFNEEKETLSVDFHPHQLIPLNSPRAFNCGYLFLQSLYSQLRFDKICRNIKNRHHFSFDLNAILSDLLYARILQPSSKRSSFDFACTLLEQPRYQLHDLYRALSLLAEESDYIQSEVYKNSNFIHQRGTSILYYDCTNYFFEIQQEDELRKYGKSKENRPNPILGMGLFMDTDGVPLAFTLYPGNQNEQRTLKPLEQKVIRDFECSEFIFCSDSGLGSQDNKLFNDLGNRSYVVTQSLKKLKKEDQELALNPTHFRKIGSSSWIDLSELDESDPEVLETIYYKEIPIESKKLSETLIVTYSPKYKKYQRKIREGQIERAQTMVACGKNKKTHRNPNDPARFVRKTSVTQNGEAADLEYFELNQEAIEKEERWDGFYAVTTDIDGDVSKIIEINKRRWQIEECFRIMKTDFEARPVYVRREDRIQAHFLTCFLALLIYRLLEIKLNQAYTVTEILKTLREMKLLKLEEAGYLPIYTRTPLTDHLHECFQFRTDTQILKKSKLRSIIKQSKIA